MSDINDTMSVVPAAAATGDQPSETMPRGDDANAVQARATAEQRPLTSPEKQLIAALERVARIEVELVKARHKLRPIKAAVADESKKRSGEIDAQLGAALRDRFGDRTPDEILAMIEANALER